MSVRPLELELRAESPSGRIRRYRLGGLATTAVLIAGFATLGGLVLAVASLPSIAAGSRDRREMSVALERRGQYGDRLRSLVEALTALDRRVRQHADRVDRIRRLYGIPDLPVVADAAPPRRDELQSIFGAAILHARRLDQSIKTTLSRSDTLIAAIAHWERDRGEEIRGLPAILPLRSADAVPVSGFGRRRDPLSGELEFHAGLDLAAPGGAAIVAPADAVVRWAGEPPTGAGETWWRFGRVVVLAHGDVYRTLFGHCDRILVRTGQRVAAGTTVATVGTSGWTPAPRLHYEVRRRGPDQSWEAIDPLSLVLDPEFAPLASSLPPEAAGADELAVPPLPRQFAR